MLEKYNMKHKTEIRVVGEGFPGTHEYNEQDKPLKQQARAPGGYSEIVAEGRRQREEALYQRHDQTLEAWRLGATQGDDSVREDHVPLRRRKRTRVDTTDPKQPPERQSNADDGWDLTTPMGEDSEKITVASMGMVHSIPMGRLPSYLDNQHP